MRVIDEKWQEDPAFYKPLSQMLREAIEAFRAGRIQEKEYLRRATEGMNSALNRTGDQVPASIANNAVAKAYFGAVKEVFGRFNGNGFDAREVSAEVGLGIDRIVQQRRIVNWITNVDQQNRMRQDIEDFLFQVKSRYGIDLTFEDVDAIMDQSLDIAKVRCP